MNAPRRTGPSTLEHAPGAGTGSPPGPAVGSTPPRHHQSEGEGEDWRHRPPVRPPEGGYLHSADVTGHRGGDDDS